MNVSQRRCRSASHFDETKEKRETAHTKRVFGPTAASVSNWYELRVHYWQYSVPTVVIVTFTPTYVYHVYFEDNVLCFIVKNFVRISQKVIIIIKSVLV